MVLLGGGPGRHPSYLGDLGGLAERRTLVMPFPRGVGPSPMPSDPVRASWWEEAADVDALRRHLRIERVTVVAHSAGTRTALAFAARYPASLERLVLITPPASWLVDDPSDVPAIRSRRSDAAFTAALATAQQGPPTDADDDALTAWQRSIAPLSYAAWDTAQQAHSRVGGWSAAAVDAFGRVDPPSTFATDLRAVRAPVRVIAGAEDAVVGVVGPLALTRLFRDGRGSTVDGAGHYPWIDRPVGTAEALEAALTS